MNLLEARLEKKDGRFVADGGGVVAAVDEDRFGPALVEGRDVTVGIRPHDFEMAGDAARAVTTLKVELVEALGFEAFAHGWLRASGPRVIARIEADRARQVHAGDQLPLGVSPARVHLFDPQTGLSLDAAKA
jgi:ABC-type sugar transport system ATPase subunit